MDDTLRSSGPRVDDRGIRPPAAFHIEELSSPPGTLVLRLVGELDLAATGAFRERVDSALAAGALNVVLDMRETSFLDSSMLRELLRASAAAAAGGGRLVLAGVVPAVERLFALTRVSGLLVLVPSPEAALDVVSGGAAAG